MIGDDETQTFAISISGMHCIRCIETIETALSKEKGISSAEVILGQARISFYPQLISMENIECLFEQSGYPIEKPEKKRGRWNRFLERIIDSNEKSFGTRKLDCCTMNYGHETHGRGTGK